MQKDVFERHSLLHKLSTLTVQHRQVLARASSDAQQGRGSPDMFAES